MPSVSEFWLVRVNVFYWISKAKRIGRSSQSYYDEDRSGHGRCSRRRYVRWRFWWRIANTIMMQIYQAAGGAPEGGVPGGGFGGAPPSGGSAGGPTVEEVD